MDIVNYLKTNIWPSDPPHVELTPDQIIQLNKEFVATEKQIELEAETMIPVMLGAVIGAHILSLLFL